jgi:hypothetical protein
MHFSIVLSLFALVVLATPAAAQPRAMAFDELRLELATGDRISLIQTDGEAHT